MSREHNNRNESSLRGKRRVARVLMGVYIASLAAVVIFCLTHVIDWRSFVWRPNSSNWIIKNCVQIGSSVAKDVVLFLGLGFLVGAALAPDGRDASLIRRLLGNLIAFLLSTIVALAVRTFANGTPLAPPNFVGIACLTGACLWGSWLGATWLRAVSGFGWLLRQVVLSVLIFCGGGAAFAWFALAPRPLEIASQPVSTEDRRRLVELFREHDPRDLEEGETTELTLTEKDLNQLATWGLSVVPGEHRAQVVLGADHVALQMTCQLPFIHQRRRNLNVIVGGRILNRDDVLGFAPTSLQIGRIAVPRWLLRLSGPIMLGDAWHNETTEPFFQSLKEVHVGLHQAKIVCSHLEIKKGFVRDALVGLGLSDDLEQATKSQVNRLIALAESDPNLTFSKCLETAFEEAKRRSDSGKAVSENRAAILALGCLLGHSRIRSFVGSDVPRPSKRVQNRFRRVTLRGRRDWTRHFIVSAALQVLSNALASMDVGVLKEELDADGGSGFSFADLLADRAGTMFAVCATESEEAAIAMQIRVVGGFVVSDFMPEGADLAEGLTDHQLQRQFGGVGGEAYRRQLAEIDRRITKCPGYARD